MTFHRSRHAEVLQSPLVDNPRDFLADLYRSRTFQEFRAGHSHAGQAGPMRQGAKGDPPATRRPRVAMLAGAYGQFHDGVVDALLPHADVRVQEFRRVRELRRKTMDLEVLQVVQALATGNLPELPAEQQEGIKAVRQFLQQVDVAICDWADRSSLYASYLCPPTTRLVLRIHALDSLDPWFHLIRWDSIERVVVISELMRSLVADLLAVAGATVPVEVVPNIVQIPQMNLPKLDGARHRLGMVGWGDR